MCLSQRRLRGLSSTGKHAKQLASRKQRRAAAARVEATRKALIEAERVAQKKESQQEQEKVSEVHLRARAHGARRLMEEQRAAAKLKGNAVDGQPKGDRKCDPTSLTMAASRPGSLHLKQA